MNQRVVRTANAQARAAAPAAPALRTAQRKPVRQNEAGHAEVTTASHLRKSVVSETTRASTIAAPDYGDEPLGSVQVGHGKTIPLEQYASVRIDVRVTLPCTADNVQSIAEIAHDHCVEIMQAEEDYLLGAPAQPARRANRRG